ncbi:hypothetical protein INT44_008465 [Umbelopsis vinacea]|uniref:DUF4045 domain-containing protein n=1 Tax=Umbelopsis vinacea TaxID=44442 RepID=A0A8H7PXP2_9FUNG|nr:hypothetical protein INT44_008465 [Umbelopsis vinacea]
MATSLASGVPMNASIENLLDLDSQVELRKQERQLRRQERERKRAEDLKRLEKAVQDESSKSIAAAQTSMPQPSKNMSSDRLQKLEKELDEMKRSRHSQQPSPSEEIKPAVVLKSQLKDAKVEVKVEKKLNIGKAATPQEKEAQVISLKQASAPSGIVAKAKERFSKEEEAHIVRPKVQEKSFSAPIVKKDVSMEHKEDILPKSVKPDSRKPVDQAPELSTLQTKEQPKKSVLSRYNVANESTSNKTAPNITPARPLRTSTTLAERAAIFKEVKQPEAVSPPINKRKSMPVMNFGRMLEEESDIDVNISPSVCVSHRFGQPPQVITRKAWPTNEKESSTIMKKELISDLRNHPTAAKKVSKIITSEQEVKGFDLKSNQKMMVTSSPVELSSSEIIQLDVSNTTPNANTQDLMTRSEPPLQSLKQPIKPRSQRKKTNAAIALKETVAEGKTESLEAYIKIEEQDEVVKIQQKATTMEQASPVSMENKRTSLNSNAQAVSQVTNKPAAENEANAIRARMLEKRRSTPLMGSNPKPYVPKISEDQLSFSELRASLGRRGTENFRNATEKMIEQRGRKMNITTYRWSASSAATENKSSSPLSGKAASELHRPSPKVLPQVSQSTSALITTRKTEQKTAKSGQEESRISEISRPPPKVLPQVSQSASVLMTSRKTEQQDTKMGQEKSIDSEIGRPSPTVLPQTSKSTSVVPRVVKNDNKVDLSPVSRPLGTKAEVRPKAVSRTDSPAKAPIQHTREQVKRIPTEPTRVFKQELDKSKASSNGRNSLKKRAYSVSDLKAIHKKFEQAQQENSHTLMKVAPTIASVRKSQPFEPIPVSIPKVTPVEVAPKSVAPIEFPKRNSSLQMDTVNRIAAKKLPPVGLFNKPVTSPIKAEKDVLFKRHEEPERHETPVTPNTDDRVESFVGKLEMPVPSGVTAEFAQTGISNLQIVSPTPRKLSPEPILFHNEQSEDVTHSAPAPSKNSSSHKDENWRVRKQLPFKLDMDSYNKHQHKAHVEEQPSYIPEDGLSDRELPEVIPFVATAQYDECIANSRRRASMPIPDAYLRATMNRSPSGSDDSSTLDTPKESKKVSFSPTITTFRLDPVDESEDANYDYFGSVGKNSILSEEEYDFQQSPISQLPPPLESNPSYSRHQRTASAPQSDYGTSDYGTSDFGTDDKRDTSAFWKAFSSEMTNAPNIYRSSGRDDRISMLPPPDSPENYYGSNASQRKPPAWVKNSLEGGRPEPSLPAPSPWRQSGLWENLFGRKNGEKM